MRFEALGPLQVVREGGGAGGGVLSLGGPKQRLVLALLLAEPNSVVSVDRLVDGVWADRPPGSARHTLQAYVSELRKTIGEAIEHRHGGYCVAVDAATFDVLDFEHRVEIARRAESTEATISVLEDALELWRGRAYEEFADNERLRAEGTRLDAVRLGSVEELMAARLEAGLHAEIAAELDGLARQHPFREELRALHMIALYRCGRQAEALRAYQTTREVLADELGLVPSPRLRELEEQILLQDPALELASGTGAPPPPNGSIENPYLGLRPFREADHARFFGRDDLIDTLLERVSTGGFTALVGPSGSGKSSVVHAGLVSRLGELRPDTWVASMKPGTVPFAELDAALAERAHGGAAAGADRLAALAATPGAPGVLVIDQFEELYTMVEDSERSAFTALLARVAVAEPQSVHVLVTLRADCYDRPLADAHLAQLFADNVVNVPALGPGQLEAAAVQPARQVDIAVQPRLVGRLIADVAGQPNALPLFQYALTELFDERDGPLLDLATYERIGGVRKAVARRAESVYAHLDEHEQAAARQFFLRIATVSGEIVGKRRVPASELVSLEVDVVALRAAIDAFARYRLVALDRDPVTGAPTVEVAHEALLNEWHRLRSWIDEHRDDLAKQAAFAVAVDEWERSERDDGYLLTGSRLDDYESWATTTSLRLTTTERDFIAAATAARDQTSADHARRDEDRARLKRRSRRQLALLFAVCALAAGIIAYPLVSSAPGRDAIALVLDSEADDNSFAGVVAGGFDSAADEFGLDGVLLEPPYTDLEDDVRRMLEDEPQLVFGTFVMHDMLLDLAADHGATTFALLDYNEPPPVENAAGVGFAVEQGAFLVGAAAALESQTGKIGYIGANAHSFIEAFRAGFEQGAEAADPDVEVVSALIDPVLGYDQPNVANRLATDMYESGADVVFVAAGGSAEGVVQAATEISRPGRHLWAIGADADQFFQLGDDEREHLLTSMVKRFDSGIRATVEASQDGTLVPGDVHWLSLADGAVGYSDSAGNLRSSTVELLDGYEAEIVSEDRSVASEPEDPPDRIATDGATVTVRFDGSACSYEGPGRISGDSIQVYRFANESDRPATLQVWKVPEGTSIDTVTDALADADPTTDLAVWRDAGSGETMLVAGYRRGPGVWFIQCSDDDADYPAAIVNAG